MRNECYWILLQLSLGSSVPMASVLKYFGSPENIINAGEAEWKICPHFTDKQVQRLCMLSFSRAESIVEECEKNSWSLLTPDSNLYPTELLTLSDFPPVLYAQGDISLLSARLVAVSGTRNMTHSGLENVQNTVEDIYSNSGVVVSGAADGCDLMALESAYINGAVAVTAWGLGCAPDKKTYEIMNKTAENGLIVTCFEPYKAASLASYQVRNKLIASLCESFIAVEAGEKSGVLKMATSFSKLDKPVYAVEGSVGCNRLIASGARIWNGYFEEGFQKLTLKAPIQPQIKKNVKTEINLDNLSQNAIIVYNILKARQGVFEIDEVITESGLTPTQTACALTELEIMGIAVAEACGYRVAGL